jgi:hypothetical protein
MPFPHQPSTAVSEPKRFTYPSPADLPSPDELLRHLDRQHHLVLQFPVHAVESRKRELIQTLEQQLPEYCSVFDSGGNADLSWITINQVISRPELLRLEDELLQAARHFHHSAHSLAHRLAEHNRVPAENLWEHAVTLKPFSGEWQIDPHGGDICFKNKQNGQIVEVNVWFGYEFGILDPMFFHTYLRTTDGLRCPPELSDDFHDPARALTFLEERGRLTRICSIFHQGSGVFAHDA